MKHVLLVSLASFALAGCDKKDGSESKSEAAKPTPPTETKPAEAKPEDTKPAAVTPPAPEDFANGYCRVTGSGAITFDQKKAHTGGSMLNVMQWHTEDMRKQVGYANEGIILNCNGSDVRLGILSGRDKTFPMKPATYKIGKKGDLSVLGSVAHPSERNGLSLLVQDGTLEITAFDDKHIAGKGELTAKTLPDKGEVKLAIEFDMKCHNLSGCPK